MPLWPTEQIARQIAVGVLSAEPRAPQAADVSAAAHRSGAERSAEARRAPARVGLLRHVDGGTETHLHRCLLEHTHHVGVRDEVDD